MCRDDGTWELVTTTEESAEEDEPEVLITTTEASIEKAEDTTLLSECLDGRGGGVFTVFTP